ncbi:MAG: histidine phosphatase family protein [Pseudomonadales bacterium]|nr:histidine phosphatase family protein [Pseudomonadales bacterium]
MKQLFFIRHGQTKWNAIRRMQGQLNSDLNEIGEAQADVNGRFLESQKLDKLIASPLGRCVQTANIINQHTDLDLSFDERIKEWHCGDWSGLMWDELSQRYPKEWEAYQFDRFNYRGPGCENFPDMIDRVRPFLRELKEDSADTIGIVSHGLVGRVMVSVMMGMDETETLAFRQANDVIYRVTIAPDSKVLDHFTAGQGPMPGWIEADHYP